MDYCGSAGWVWHRLGSVLCVALLALFAGVAHASDPVIDIWYDDAPTFGLPGNPQQWVNVLGNVSDPDGLSQFYFTLNGQGPRLLAAGPDQRRLWSPGDFNIEIDYEELVDGLNVVEITAVDTLGNSASRTVNIDYAPGNVWPADFTADWSQATEIRDYAQPLDGEWDLVPGGIRPSVLGYDRTLILGDLAWTDYEVTIPITIHGIDPAGYQWPSVNPGIGFTQRWIGHQFLSPGEQPRVYWLPSGVNLWYNFGTSGERLSLGGGKDVSVPDLSGRTLDVNVTYYWKLRSETQADGQTFYGGKVWRQGDPEPANWDLSALEQAGGLHHGCLILVAHHVDATFGNIEVTRVTDDAASPVISDIEITADQTTATVSWVTNKPTSTVIDYGETTAYGSSVSDPTLRTLHEMTLTGLQPGTLYHMRIAAQDALGNLGTSPDRLLNTVPPSGTSPITSDDFSSPTLDTDRWTFLNPLGDATLTMTGTQAQIVLPDNGQVHDVWNDLNTLPRLLQASPDTDFEVEAKFESPLTAGFQSQGILIEQDSVRVVRAEFHHAGGQMKVWTGTIFGSVSQARSSQVVALNPPMYLRVNRTGDLFTISYSADGAVWNLAASFTQPMTVTGVSVYGGNAGVGHTSTIDYLFNTASPVVPEDGGGGTANVSVNVVGSGSVQLDPDQPSYDVGDLVQFTAVPDPGWSFDSWSGDLTGSINPAALNVTATTQVTATFIEDQQPDTTAPVLGNVQVTPGLTSALVTWTTDEPATSRVDYGLDTGYGDAVTDGTLKTSHSLTLTGLLSATTYHFEIGSADAAGNLATSGDLTFDTDAPVTGSITSDDFSSPSLDAGLWTFLNPLGDATLNMTGTQAQIVLSNNGEVHDTWAGINTLPRLWQAAPDTDFEVEAKFESPLTAGFQSQGILIEQDSLNLVRAEFHNWAGQTKVFVATIFGPSAQTRASIGIFDAAPFYLRVGRVGDTFTITRSTDGSTWIPVTSFTQPMTVTGVSVFGGNGGVGHTATIDYLFNTASPIVPEDGGGTPADVSVGVIGSGSVLLDPDQPSYDVGDLVQFTAVPDPGWSFDSWSGDLTGSTNPAALNVTATTQVTATFVQLDTTAPVIGNVQVTPSLTSAQVTWTTDEPATSRVDYGLDTGYGDAVTDGTLKTSHSLTLTGLLSATTYHFEIGSADAAGNLATSGDLTFDTDAPATGPITSDDFSSPSLDAGLWTFLNPLGDATLNMTGSQAQIVLPNNGEVHDTWVDLNTLPRLWQAAPNTDFEVEAKFESPLTTSFQSQGILIEQDSLNLVRAEFHYYAGQTKVFVATIFGPSGQTRANIGINETAPFYLRVGRVGDTFTITRSSDGSTWTPVTSFTQPMTVTGVSVYGGNTGVGHTSTIDYLFNTASPIVPEDGGGTPADVSVGVIGSGSVLLDPDQPSYDVGDLVQFTAVPDPGGWSFDSWSGDLTGSTNPAALNVTATTQITATFVPDQQDTTAPVLGNVQVTPGLTSALVTWTTDEPATSRVDYGLDTGYGDAVTDGTLKTSHSLTLTGLLSATTYHFEIGSADAAGNLATSGDLTFDTDAPVTGSITSDDFSSPSLNAGLWTFLNPLGDATLNMTGTQAQIVLSNNGEVHDTWAGINTLPRLWQAAPDTDFEVEAKFESPLTAGFQSQGILIEQDSLNLVRAEFHNWAGQTKVFVATIFGPSAQTRASIGISDTAPFYLRVGRVGDAFTISRSSDGSTWIPVTSFTQPMTVTGVSVFGGNAGVGHTATIDYLFNTASPIVPEDGGGIPADVSVNVIGLGSVQLDPDQPSYDVGDLVQFTAVPDPGWSFDSWSGDLTGSFNPAALNVTATTQITATFVPDQQDTTAPVIGNVQVTPDLTSALVTWTTDEPATSRVDYGLDTGYGDTVTDGTLKTSHSLTLPGLVSATTYHFEVGSADAAGNLATSGDLTFDTDAPVTGSITSDDFSSPSLDTGLWTFLNPLGDATLNMTGTQAQIVLSNNGEIHDTWAGINTLPRLWQAAPDTDFEVEAKFESPLTAGFQSQGILIEQDSLNLVRAEFHNWAGQTKVFVATIFGPSAQTRASVGISDTAPFYLRVGRVGDTFTITRSSDGSTWLPVTSFTQPMTVTGVSVFGGNGGVGHTATIDYLFNTASPVVPEDGP